MYALDAISLGATFCGVRYGSKPFSNVFNVTFGNYGFDDWYMYMYIK